MTRRVSLACDHLYDMVIREQRTRDLTLKPCYHPLTLSVQIKHYLWHHTCWLSSPTSKKHIATLICWLWDRQIDRIDLSANFGQVTAHDLHYVGFKWYFSALYDGCPRGQQWKNATESRYGIDDIIISIFLKIFFKVSRNELFLHGTCMPASLH